MEIQSTFSMPYYKSDYKKGIIKILGRSIDDDVREFYDIVLKDIKEYVKEKPKYTTLIIYFDYYNTPSSKYLFDILNIFKELMNDGKHKVVVNWYHDEDDMDMVETVNDYQKMIGISVNTISKKIDENIFNII